MEFAFWKRDMSDKNRDNKGHVNIRWLLPPSEHQMCSKNACWLKEWMSEGKLQNFFFPLVLNPFQWSGWYRLLWFFCSGSPFHLPVEFSDLRMTSPLIHCHFVLHFIVKNLPAMQKTQVQSLGEEDPMEKEMANHSSILAWRSPWTEQPVGL